MNSHDDAGASLELRHITKRFSVATDRVLTCTALDDVSLSLDSGTCTLVGGANGSGKSVLMAIIAGLMKPTSGTVKVTGRDNKSAEVGLIFQEPDAQILGETPYEDVMYGPRNLGLNKKESEEYVLEALEKVGLGKKKLYPSRFLSGGEKRRLAVAGILAMNMPLVIFDEPYANLDYDGVRQVNQLVSMLKSENKTVIILTHELEKSLGLCGRFIILHKGCKVFDGLPQDGLKSRLEQWGIRNPLVSYHSVQDLVWL